MLNHLKKNFDRYCRVKLRLDARKKFTLPDLQIENFRLEHNRLYISAKTRHTSLGISLNKTDAWVKFPHQETAGGWTLAALSLPYETGRLQLLVRRGSAIETYNLRNFSKGELLWAKAKLLPHYLALVATSLLDAYLWLKLKDLTAKERIKLRMGLTQIDTVETFDPLVFSPCPLARPFESATLVLPVYNALNYLKKSLARIEDNSDLTLHIILIEDCSSDPQVRPFLREWNRENRRFNVTLIENDINLGFVSAANIGLAKAMEIAPNQPVILFNSDAMVPKNWVSRILAPLADPSVASVTPMSNDAEIFNIPLILKRIDLNEDMVDHLDALAGRLNPMSALAPTGVGFCMAMSPHYLAQLPQFDTIFGRGYGEENDWCQRAQALGGRNIGIGNLFVEHRGGTSFGTETKPQLIAENGAEIARRYPNYHHDVQDFILSDPLASTRMVLAIAWAELNQEQPLSVWLAHSLGGGAENDLQHRLKTITTAGGSSLVLRIGQFHHRWTLQLYTPLGMSQIGSNDIEEIAMLIALLPQRKVIYSCGVGDPAPHELPQILARLAGFGAQAIAGGPQEIEILFHDFYPISPSYNLLDSASLYHGPPKGEAFAKDLAHNPLGGINLADWQKIWGQLAGYACYLTVFSPSSAAILAEIWPEYATKIRLQPHQFPQKVMQLPSPPQGAKKVLGVLGNINVNKGAHVLQRLSKQLSTTQDLSLVVIGEIDPAIKLCAPAKVHGSYDLEDLPLLAKRYGITAWFIPSIWPETFSFTTHEVLATGLPVFVFDLGAQADAVRQAIAEGKKGALLPLERAFCLRVEDFIRDL